LLYLKLSFFIWCLIVAFFITSCDKKERITLEKYTEEDLIEILVDVTLARSAVSGWPASLADSVKRDHYLLISQLHGIEEKELYLILESLSSKPEYFQRLLNIAADSMRNRNEKLNRKE
jgi:hypothetical protein